MTTATTATATETETATETKATAPREIAGFPREEYESRWSAVQAAAKAAGVDGVVAASRGGGAPDTYADVFYLTGFRSPFPLTRDVPGWWAGRSHAIAVMPLESEPTLVTDTEAAIGNAACGEVRAGANVAEAAAEAIQDRGLAGRRLAFVGDNAMHVGAFKLMTAALPDTELVHLDSLIEKVRVVKSPRELVKMRRAAEVGTAAMDAMMKAALVPGTTEAQAVAEACRVLVAEGGSLYDAACASGPTSFKYSHGQILSWTTRSLEAGDLFHVDFYGTVDGYLWDFARTCVVGGKPTAEQTAILDAGVEAVEAGMAATRAGVAAKDVYFATRRVLEKRGVAGEGFGGDSSVTPGLTADFPAHGHSYGTFWEAPWLLPDEDTPLETNMCLAIEVMTGKPGVGAGKCEQDVIVTDDGCELLTTGPTYYV